MVAEVRLGEFGCGFGKAVTARLGAVSLGAVGLGGYGTSRCGGARSGLALEYNLDWRRYEF